MKRDYSIDEFRARAEYIIDNNDLCNYDRKKWIEEKVIYNGNGQRQTVVGGEDYELEKAANYLLRAKDIESESTLERNYYRDDSMLSREYKYRKPESNGKVDSDFPTEEDYVVKSVLRDFSLENWVDDYVEIFTHEDSMNKEILEYIVSVMANNIQDETDYQILNLFLNEVSRNTISKKLRISKSTVNRRLKALLGNI